MKLLVTVLLTAIVTFGVDRFLLKTPQAFYLNGQLSACTDIMGALTMANGIPYACVKENGQVLIAIEGRPGVKFKLDGTPIVVQEQNQE